MAPPFYPELLNSITDKWLQPPIIQAHRKNGLDRLLIFLRKQTEEQQPIALNFICTHNSRRSHLAQILAQTAAHYFNVARVSTYSGGTEATAFHPNALAALERAGFGFGILEAGKNPTYRIDAGPDLSFAPIFSKVFDHSQNPSSHFAAVMVCSHADENCPFVPGASARISMPYDDPKEADGHAREALVYDQRLEEIARDLFYVFSQVR